MAEKENQDECEWKCKKCGKTKITNEFKYNRLRCDCGYWMEWHILQNQTPTP